MDTYDVVVIGYGPVGQMAQRSSGRPATRSLAFERHAQLYGLSRAGHIDDEIMRTLQTASAPARSSARTRSRGSSTTCATRRSAATCC